MTTIDDPVAERVAPADRERTDALIGSALFGAATEAELAELVQSCRVESVPAGGRIIKEGDKPDDLYILLEGELLVYAHDDLGRELALERLSQLYRPIGEQAFLTREGARRSASVRAIANCRLLRVPGRSFRDLLERDHALQQTLREIGAEQIRRKVLQQMAWLRHVTSSAAGLNEQTFPDGATVCRQGDVGREVFVILSGAVRVLCTQSDGSIVQVARLQAGQSFGELSLIEGKPRTATVVADGELRVLAVASEDFQRAFEADEHVRSHAAALRSIYNYGDRGVVVQFTSELFDRPALATLYRLEDGRSVVAHRVIGQDVWSIQDTDAPSTATQAVFVDRASGAERTLLVSGETVVGGIVVGAWAGIGQLHRLVLEGAALSPIQLDAFTRSGDLVEPPPAPVGDDAIVCHCMRVRRSTLIMAMEFGCETVQALSTRTGAGTVCGGCVPRLAELTAETLWQTVRCLEVIDRSPRVKSFRFAIPADHGLGFRKPGQRIVIQAVIDGIEVQRPYTLTAAVTEQRYYEITVQREPNGIMSNWLFDTMRPGSTIAVLPPGGTCFFDLADPRPLVCLVGGIGVTPALAVCRSAAVSGAGRRVHVDYSVGSREQIVCGEELSEISRHHRNVSCKVRITGEAGRFQAADLAALAGDFPNADWLICGSKPFNANAQRMLLEQGVPAHHLHIEAFDAVGGALPGDPATTALLTPRQRELVGYGLLVGVALFLVQGLLGVHWPGLDRLQAAIPYRALTGAAIVALLMYQWRLGFLRWRDRADETPRAYGLHIAIGPATLAAIWLHSAHLGAALSLAVSLAFLASLATGAFLGAHPRSPEWEGTRRLLLGSHILLSCVGTGLAITHGFTALWY